jgi:hypothetical protein
MIQMLWVAVIVTLIAYSNAFNVSDLEQISGPIHVLDEGDQVIGFTYGADTLWRVTDFGFVSAFDFASKQWTHTNSTPIDKIGFRQSFFSLGKRFLTILMPDQVAEFQMAQSPRLYFWDDKAGQFVQVQLEMDSSLMPVGNGPVSFAITIPDPDANIAYTASAAPSSQPYVSISKLEVQFVDGIPLKANITGINLLRFSEQLFVPFMLVKDGILYAFIRDDTRMLKYDIAYTIDLKSNTNSSIPLLGISDVSMQPWDEAYLVNNQLLTFGFPNDDPAAIWSLDFTTGQWSKVAPLPEWKHGLGYAFDQKKLILYLENSQQGVFASQITA